MLDFSEILISDKALFVKHLKEYNSEISELNFTNIFMWRNFYSHFYTLYLNYLCLISIPKTLEPFAYIPVGAYEKESFLSVVLKLNEFFHKNNLKLKFSRIAENEIKKFEEIKLPFNIHLESEHCDYIYSSAELISLNYFYKFIYLVMKDAHIAWSSFS